MIVLRLCCAVVFVFVRSSLAAYGIDCSIWQRNSFTDAVVSCLKSTKNAEFISIGAINRSGVGINVTPNPGVKAMTDRGWAAGMQGDVYIFLTKALDYYQQIAGPVDDLKQQGVRFNKIWIDIENDNHWSTDVATNVAGLKACLRACRDKGVDCGIYSAKYFWNVAFAGVTGRNKIGRVLCKASSFRLLAQTPGFFPSSCRVSTFATVVRAMG